jgi:predicted Holliday junction resolvase-like endonuclease
MNTPMLTVAVAVVVALMLVWLGYQLARNRIRDTQAWITHQKAALDAEWRQLDQTRRVRSVFWAARQAMHAEAAENTLWPPATDDMTTNRNRTDDQESAR